MKECGKCGMCCYTSDIIELNKKHYTWCKYFKDKCEIYDTRPLSCKSFACYWLNSDLSEDLRPDKCGVMFERVVGYPIYLAVTFPYQLEALQSKEIGEVIKSLIEKGYSVVTGHGPGGRSYIFPSKSVSGQEVIEMIKKAQNDVKDKIKKIQGESIENGSSVIHN